MQSVIVDQREPLSLAKELINQQGLQEQISLLEGDFNTIDLDRDYDVVLVSGVVLIKPPRSVVRYLAAPMMHCNPEG